ncbi:MAG TPA: HutD family protein [Pseudorhodoplanes sp.]|nr:HutD family protein [Pseudorhodoplanes sp.]
MKIIRNAEQKRMPWKNGGGETVEITRSPSNSNLDTFDWRVSRARIDRAGPFSSFPGIDRTLCVLDGDGIRLRIGACEPFLLSTDSPPFSFLGEQPVESDLVRGVVTDLNIMTRRDRFRHHVTVAGNVAIRMPLRACSALVVFSTGTATVVSPEGKARLERHDAAVLHSQEGEASILPVCRSPLYIVRIRPTALRENSPYGN